MIDSESLVHKKVFFSNKTYFVHKLLYKDIPIENIFVQKQPKWEHENLITTDSAKLF